MCSLIGILDPACYNLVTTGKTKKRSIGFMNIPVIFGGFSNRNYQRGKMLYVSESEKKMDVFIRGHLLERSNLFCTAADRIPGCQEQSAASPGDSADLCVSVCIDGSFPAGKRNLAAPS